MEDYYEYLDSNGVTTLYKLIKDDTVSLIDSYSVTINGITTTLDTHINDSDIHTPIADIESMVDTKISGLVNSAPETLDTLKELSDALGNDTNFATTIANQIGNKASKDSVYTKEETNTLLEGKANTVHTHVVNDITDFPTIPTKTSELINDSGFLTSSSGVITSVSWSDITNKPNFATVATSGSYNDLSNKPTIPNVYNKTLTIQKNGTNVATFTSNSNSDVTANITVPTKLSQLENDMGFGIGGDTSDCVHKTGNETINGVKIFNDTVIQKKEGIIKNDNIDITTTPSSDLYTQLFFNDKNNIVKAFVRFIQLPNDVNEISLFVRDKHLNYYGVYLNTNNEFFPLVNNTYNLGTSSRKWANVYSTNGHITYTYTHRVTTYSITHPTDDSYFFVSGGTDYNKGATLYLGGTSATNFTPGRFALAARKTDGSSVELAGSPNGSLTWGGQDIATTAWVRNYVNSVARINTVGSSVSAVNSVAGSRAVGSSIAAYYSNATTLTAEGSSSSSGSSYPSDYSDYIDISPTVGTMYTGSQLFSTLNASASGSKFIPPQSTSYQTTAKATATFSGAFSSSAKYLCTTANAVRFRAYVSEGTTSDIGTASVVDNSSAKSIFTRVQ